MSHTTSVKTKITNPIAFERTCQRLGLKYKVGEVTEKLFSNNTATGFGSVHFEGWRYPMVVREDGYVFSDIYEGAWGDIKHFDNFVQEYSLEQVLLQSEQMGLQVMTAPVKGEDGKYRLQLTN